MATCQTPDLGRIQAVGLFLLDDCMRPIHGPAAGYIDDCPAAFSSTDNTNTSDEFRRQCADGSTKVFIPGVASLDSIETNVDMHWIDPEWVAQAGGAEPITQNGQVVGWGDAVNSRFNVLVVVWQEILGGGACGDEGGNGSYVRLYPIKGARITEEGDVGSAENYTRITGLTFSAHELGAGPIPLAQDELGEAEWLSDCIPTGLHRVRFVGAGFPEECGAVDTTEEPTVPCLETS